MGGMTEKHYSTLVGLCDESIGCLYRLGYIDQLHVGGCGIVVGTFVLTEKGRRALGRIVRREENQEPC